MADYNGYDYKSDIIEAGIHPKGILDTKLGSVYGEINIKPISYSEIDIKPISSRENYFLKWKREIKDLTSFSKAFVLPLMAIPLAVSGVKAVLDAISKRKNKEDDK